MRWPLRNQVLVPMVGLMLVALAGVSLVNAFLSVRRVRRQIEQELAQVIQTLTKSNFPLTSSVLGQMRGLAQAEFVLADPTGGVIASSSPEMGAYALPADSYSAAPGQINLAQPIEMGERRFFHSSVELRRVPGGNLARLHIFYPEDHYRQAWRDAVYPPLLIGGAAIVMVVGVSFSISSGVTRPLRRLQRQVDDIAQGSFQSLPELQRDDEVADLIRSINRMARTLAQYEEDVRRNERLRTLGQLGGGIAHQLRNSVTGCRMAVELHARECSQQDEGLGVALRQLALMERFLQRFLALGRAGDQPHAPVVLQQIVDNVMGLVSPAARHVNVTITRDAPESPLAVLGNADGLDQALVNLVLNGIEAAASRGETGSRPLAEPPAVRIVLRKDGDQAELAVEDNGPGPAADVAERLFEPFVTEKPDGTGLGLAVAKEIITAHGGRLHWSRRESVTRFVIDLPLKSSINKPT